MANKNRLIHELSAYLLQHAHNPVDWYPWGNEALTRAKAEDKPILVSIGYSACHWCHVMERESFENEEVAAYMNEHFINIKIDREERPDLDHIYMDALQTMTGGGGWPLNIFLTPALQPFYGGTYFPPRATTGMACWMDVLKNIVEAYISQRDKIEEQAFNLTQHLKQSNLLAASQGNDTNWFTPFWLDEIEQKIEAAIDTEWGGTGHAPKFPQTGILHFLMARQYKSFIKNNGTGHIDATAMAMPAQGLVFLTIDKILQGGIYDHIGGGIARYATDRRWLVPHFEKMLYDNALFISLLCDAYKATQELRYANAIHQCMGFIERDMLQGDGGFFAALDADSDGREGAYYTWQKEEIDMLLQKDAMLYEELYNITPAGNWEGTNILYRFTDLEAFAKKQNKTLPELECFIANCHARLLQARYKRNAPLRDEKIVLSWNAFMNSACSQAYAATGILRYKELAIKNMDFILNNLQGEGGFYHSWTKGHAGQHAFLDDYAALSLALIDLYEISGVEQYIKKAGEVLNHVMALFKTTDSPLLTYTPIHQQDVIIRKRDILDGATPSGNALAVKALLKLATHFDRNDWENKAQEITKLMGRYVTQYPTSFGQWVNNMLILTEPSIQVVTVGEEESYHKEMLKYYIPGAQYVWGMGGETTLPLLQNMGVQGKTLIYVCKNKACNLPAGNPTKAVAGIIL